ncbi:hypothetical protein V7654_11005 [Bacillus sp. JJ1609]|uniref:hypothetical protein n=1 Tax=Bacillus sp. JJ1609 TaxID=3122977 RepID=UPI003000BCA7
MSWEIGGEGMLLEVYTQSIDATGLYSVYLALLLSMSISAFWIVSDTYFSESYVVNIKFKPSVSETAFKNQAELGLRIQLLRLKRIKIKIDPGDEDHSFFSLIY